MALSDSLQVDALLSRFTSEVLAHRSVDYPYNPFDEIDQLHEDFDNRLVLDGFNAAECYRHGKVNVVVECNFRGLALEYIFGLAPRIPTSLMRSYVHLLQKKAVGDEIGVFVSEVEVVEGANKIALPSIVWLQPRQDQPDGLGNFLALCAKGVFETKFILDMREIRSVRRLAIKDRASRDGLVQCASHVVKSVCGDKPYFRVHRGHGDGLHGFPRLRIAIRDCFQIEILNPPVDCNFAVSDVAFGPFNL